MAGIAYIGLQETPMEENIDLVRLNFSDDSLWVLNICLGIIMFGVALGLHLNDFRAVLKNPKPALLGIISQFILLPAVTFLLVILLKPTPSIALGMMLVAACPGGNISNFISQMAGANTALSISLTAFSTSLAIFFTPLNLEIWGSLYAPTASLLQEVSLDPMEVFRTIFLILGLPLVAGLLCNHYYPRVAHILVKVLRPLSIIIFAAFVIIAFKNNRDIFLRFLHIIVLLVLLHNATALGSGYSLARLFRLSLPDQKTLTIETGIQNSGLALLLIFSFFEGLGGMAIIAGWWGIWHLISGLAIAWYWSPRKSSLAGA